LDKVFIVDGLYELSFGYEIPEGDEDMIDAPSDGNGTGDGSGKESEAYPMHF
jgi:hypothetical protein